MTTKEKIDAYIAKAADWRGDLIKEIRRTVMASVPGMEEDWKWNSPFWCYNGMVCSASAFKNHVRLTFLNGAVLDDPAGFFNDGLDAKNSRAVSFRKGDELDKAALKAMVVKAAAHKKNE